MSNSGNPFVAEIEALQEIGKWWIANAVWRNGGRNDLLVVYMTPSNDKVRELAAEIFLLFAEPDGISEGQIESLIETALREAVESNAIVTSDEGTSYCKFCNQQARTIQQEHDRIRVQHAEDLLAVEKATREACAKIADTFEFDPCLADGHDHRWCSFCDAVQHASNSIAQAIREQGGK